MPGSEFGGDPGLVQPLPHVPTVSEQLSLEYRTGDRSGSSPPQPEVFEGLIPADQLLEIRTAEGVMEKGQIWEQMMEDARLRAEDLKPEGS